MHAYKIFMRCICVFVEKFALIQLLHVCSAGLQGKKEDYGSISARLGEENILTKTSEPLT